MNRRASTDLPLHTESALGWLFSQMVDLSGTISKEYGRNELLRRLADPPWFQAFSCVLGFDWHSSGVTTTMEVVKEALSPQEHGVAVVDEKGATSRKALDEIDSSTLCLSLCSQKCQSNPLDPTADASAETRAVSVDLV